MKLWILITSILAASAGAQQYTTCSTWKDLVHGKGNPYAQIVRISDPGSKDRPVYTGFWYFDVQQFDATGRYALAMKVGFQNRQVQTADIGEIGYYDLQDRFRWTKIGQTTA